MGITRQELTGHTPVVEYRASVGKFFVVYPDLDLELVMAFDNRGAAFELAKSSYLGIPFFTIIPTVIYQTPYPRPWLSYPTDQVLSIELRIA